MADYKALRNLIVNEQLVNICPESLSIHLNDSSFGDIKTMCDQAERYLQAHNQMYVNALRWLLIKIIYDGDFGVPVYVFKVTESDGTLCFDL